MSFFKNIFGKGPSFELEDDKGTSIKKQSVTPSSTQKKEEPKEHEKKSSISVSKEDAKYGALDKYATYLYDDKPLPDDELDFDARQEKGVKIYDPALGKNVPKYTYRYERPPIYENRNIVILAIENSSSVNEYQNKVLSVINKIITDNKSDLFMFFKLTKNSSHCDLMSYEELKSSNVLSALFDTETAVDFVNLSEVMKQIYTFISEQIESSIVTHNSKKYKVQNIRILFVGTGLMDEEEQGIASTIHFLNCLKCNSLTKSIKYFCIKDIDAINIAKMGFPIIGHLESNFYK